MKDVRRQRVIKPAYRRGEIEINRGPLDPGEHRQLWLPGDVIKQGSPLQEGVLRLRKFAGRARERQQAQRLPVTQASQAIVKVGHGEISVLLAHRVE